MTSTWPQRDYTSPGLTVVRPDHAFPHVGVVDQLHHPWKYLRRDVPHAWYADRRHPLMGVMNRDEATLLHNIGLSFSGARALEIGSWIGWSTCHLALAGVVVDSIDPAHDDPAFRADVEASLADAGVAHRVVLHGGASPDAIDDVAAIVGERWSLFIVDGDHEGRGPSADVIACLPHAAPDCAFVFHDVASPDVADALDVLDAHGFQVVVYQTAQIMAMAWRGDVRPVPHTPDPEVAWQLPTHLVGRSLAPDGEPEARIGTTSSLLDALDDADDPVLPRVCIVSNEIVGPFKNGGIGTAMTGLAELLASEGFDVTVLYTGAVWTPDVDVALWTERYASIGVTLEVLGFDRMRTIAGPVRDAGFGVPHLVFEHLRERDFDVIHFNDCRGEGAACFSAKRLGLAFERTLLVMGLHSPSEWVLELNRMLPTSTLLAGFSYAERLGAACADVAWSPSHYLASWAADHGFALPADTIVQQYVMPSGRLADDQPDGDGVAASPPGRRPPPSEIVFFGRLEERKGLRWFCNALDVVGDELAERGVTVTFLGKPHQCAGMPSLDYLALRSAHWPFAHRVISDLGQPEAVAHLRGEGVLAVMPSPADNSPCTIYEAIANGVPFLATRVGGIPELVHRDDRPAVLVEPSTDGLVHGLRRALSEGGVAARPATPVDAVRAGWIDLHRRWRSLLPDAGPAPAVGHRALAIVDHVDGDLLATLAALDGCEAVVDVLVLDRSGTRVDVPARTIDVLRDDAVALADALAASDPTAVLLLHSGVTVRAHETARLLDALAATPVHGLVAATWVDRGVACAPLGGSPAFALDAGATFTGAMAVETDVARVAAKGELDPETPFFGIADRCIVTSTIWPYHVPVADQVPGTTIDATAWTPARLGAYAEVGRVDAYQLLAQGHGPDSATSARRQLAIALSDAGLGRVVGLASRGVRWSAAARRRAHALGRRARAVRHR